MTTANAALVYLIRTIERAPDDALLAAMPPETFVTDLLTRLGTVCGARPDSLMCLAKFEQALRQAHPRELPGAGDATLRLERGRRKLMETIRVARGIDQ